MPINYVLNVLADSTGTVPMHELKQAIKDAEALGADTAPLEILHSCNDPNGGWGVRIRIDGST